MASAEPMFTGQAGDGSELNPIITNVAAAKFYRDFRKSMTVAELAKTLLYQTGLKVSTQDDFIMAEFNEARELLRRRLTELKRLLSENSGKWQGPLKGQENAALMNVQVSFFGCVIVRYF